MIALFTSGSVPATNSEYNLSPWILSLLIALSKTSTLSDDERLFYATQLDTIQYEALKKQFWRPASKGFTPAF